MSPWPLVPLRHVLRLRSEIVHPRDNPRGEGRFVGLEHIEPHTGRRVGELAIRLEELTGRKARFHPGDIVYGYLRPYLNKVWVAEFDGYCSVDQYVFKIDATLADLGFVSHFMRSDAYLSQAPIDETPGQLPRIRTEEIMSVLMPLPPVAEQRRVAGQLAGQLASVAATRRETYRRTADATLLRVQAIERAIGKAAEWPSRRLAEVAEIQLGKMLSPASRMGRRPMPYLRNANVQWDRFDLSEIHEMDFDTREEAKFRLRPGDVLVCEGGEPGRAAIWAGQIDPCMFQKALHRLRPIDEAVDPQYLVYRLWLSALRGEFTGNHAQTTIAHLPAIRLAELKLGTPPIAIQRRIVIELREQLATIDAMTAALNDELEAIEALPGALLRRAFDDLAA